MGNDERLAGNWLPGGHLLESRQRRLHVPKARVRLGEMVELWFIAAPSGCLGPVSFGPSMRLQQESILGRRSERQSFAPQICQAASSECRCLSLDFALRFLD